MNARVLRGLVVVVVAQGLASCKEKAQGQGGGEGQGEAGSARRTEAELYLDRIAKLAKAYHVDRGAFPPSAPLRPERDCCAAGGRCEPSASEWDVAGWTELGFSMDDPHYYQYEFESGGEGEGAWFKARAVGDPSCQGKTQTWQIEGSVKNGAVVVTKASRT